MLLLRPIGTFDPFAGHPALLFPGRTSLCPAVSFFKHGGAVPQPMLRRNKNSAIRMHVRETTERVSPP